MRERAEVDYFEILSQLALRLNKVTKKLRVRRPATATGNKAPSNKIHIIITETICSVCHQCDINGKNVILIAHNFTPVGI
jgi:cytochrome c5